MVRVQVLVLVLVLALAPARAPAVFRRREFLKPLRHTVLRSPFHPHSLLVPPTIPFLPRLLLLTFFPAIRLERLARTRFMCPALATRRRSSSSSSSSTARRSASF